ncbi:MAG TPA: hypothetical protein VGP57_21650 [Actinoplanes sp.]|nr:hypothetical protein [Actinoplanes sp.]
MAGRLTLAGVAAWAALLLVRARRSVGARLAAGLAGAAILTLVAVPLPMPGEAPALLLAAWAGHLLAALARAAMWAL